MGKRIFAGAIFTVVLAAAAIFLMVAMGGQKRQQRQKEHQAMVAFATGERLSRMQAFAHLRQRRGFASVDSLIKALDDPDGKKRSRAVSALPVFQDRMEDLALPLAAHLQTSPYPDVRLACAIILMSTKSPEVHDAYLHALRDSSDKVAQIACREMPARAVEGDAEALHAVLDHPSWDVRLEGCKALITMKKADKRVVSTLEAMRQTPEAARYDAQIAKFERLDAKMGTSRETVEHWGKLATILQQARHITANGGSG